MLLSVCIYVGRHVVIGIVEKNNVVTLAQMIKQREIQLESVIVIDSINV